MVDISCLSLRSEPIPWTSSLLGTDSEDEESEVNETSDDSENESSQPMIKTTLFISRVLAPNHYPIQR